MPVESHLRGHHLSMTNQHQQGTQGCAYDQNNESVCALGECLVILKSNVQELLAHKFSNVVSVLFKMECEMRMFTAYGRLLVSRNERNGNILTHDH
jgi:hypothetical protein